MLKIDGDCWDAAKKAQDHSNGTLDYSSLSEVPNLQREMERERRDALDNYNESTFGERRPIASVLLRWAGMTVVLKFDTHRFSTVSRVSVGIGSGVRFPSVEKNPRTVALVGANSTDPQEARIAKQLPYETAQADYHSPGFAIACDSRTGGVNLRACVVGGGGPVPTGPRANGGSKPDRTYPAAGHWALRESRSKARGESDRGVLVLRCRPNGGGWR